jgi:hypothetical protein
LAGGVGGVLQGLTSVLNLPREFGLGFAIFTQLAQTGIFGGASVFAASSLLGPVGWVVSLFSIISGLSVPQEKFTQEAALVDAMNADGKGGIDQATGQPVKKDAASFATSDIHQGRFWTTYTVAAKTANIDDLDFSLQREIVKKPAEGVDFAVVGMTGPAQNQIPIQAVGRHASPLPSINAPRVAVDNLKQATHIDVKLRDGTIAHLEKSGDTYGMFGGVPMKAGWVRHAETTRDGAARGVPAFIPEENVTALQDHDTGNYALSLNANFSPINPTTRNVIAGTRQIISAQQATEIKNAFGSEGLKVNGQDPRVELLRPWIAKITHGLAPRREGQSIPGSQPAPELKEGDIQFRTTEQHNPEGNFYTFIRGDSDQTPDRLKVNLFDQNRPAELLLGSSMPSPDGKFKAKYGLIGSQQDIQKVSQQIVGYLTLVASRPDLRSIYLDPNVQKPTEGAQGNLANVLTHLQRHEPETIAKMDQLYALAGPPEGKTQDEQIQNMIERGQQIKVLKAQLRMTVNANFLASAPSVAAQTGRDAVTTLEGFITGKFDPKLAVDASKWGDKEALNYLATNPDIVELPEVGTDLDKVRQYWNEKGRFSGQNYTGFDASAYAAKRPELLAAAQRDLAQPVISSTMGADFRAGTQVTDSDRMVRLKLANNAGILILRPVGKDSDSGKTVFSGVTRNGSEITATAEELNALPKTSAPTKEQVDQYITEQFIRDRLSAPPAIVNGSKLDGLRYLAANKDIAKTLGPDATAGLNQYNQEGRFLNRPLSGGFDLTAYLAKPAIRAAARKAMAKPVIISAEVESSVQTARGDGKANTTYSSIALTLPNGRGQVNLAKQPPAVAGAAPRYIGTTSKGETVNYSLDEIRSFQNGVNQDEVEEWALTNYIASLKQASAVAS